MKLLMLLSLLTITGCVSLDDRTVICKEESVYKTRVGTPGYPCYCCPIGE